MEKIIIRGGNKLKGTVKISGAKNSAVALIPAAILSDEPVIINNVPNISDIDALIEILEFLGAKINRNNNTLTIDASKIQNKEIPMEVSQKLRASYYFMSSILGKYNKVEMYFPGGCNIGKRPIDQTLKAFKALGATIVEKENKYDIYAEKLKSAHIHLDMPSVGATINAIYSSVKVDGITEITNAAREPESGNVVDFLNQMGAKIQGKGTKTITITGVEYLHGTTIDVIPDRIEAGTYIIIASLLGENLKIENIIPEHIDSLLQKLKEIGVNYEKGKDYLIVNQTTSLKPTNIKTEGYPGFPTDLQQPITALLTQCDGMSSIEETIYENRFKNVEYLNMMGSDINIDGRKIYIKGKTKLQGKDVKATDLRAGACMLIAGLIADGVTTISDIEHVLRGYENIIEKLKNIGAKIEKEEI